MKELELNNDQIERNDDIDNAVHDCICILVEKEIEWNMEIIGDATDAIKKALSHHDLKVRHPGIVTNVDGSQEYAE